MAFETSSRPSSRVIALLAGLVWGIGIWMHIDAQVYSIHIKDAYTMHWFLWMPVLASTIALILVNLIKGPVEEFGTMKKVLFIMSFVVQFLALFAAGWILFATYMNGYGFTDAPRNIWPGIGVFSGTCLVFGSSMMMKFCRPTNYY